MMIEEYHLDARQIQVEGQLQQLRLRNVMAEESIKYVGKGLSTLVTLLEELAPQFHRCFQTDRHKIRLLSDAVAKSSEQSLGPIESITSQKYNFNRFVTGLHESRQAKAKVKMMRGECSSPANPSVPSHTHIGQYSRNARHLRQARLWPNSATTNIRTPRNFAEARRMDICLKSHKNWSPRHRCHSGSIQNNTCNSVVQTCLGGRQTNQQNRCTSVRTPFQVAWQSGAEDPLMSCRGSAGG